MMAYERLIIDIIPGDTPKAKHERLMAILLLLQRIGWPRRGTVDEKWTVYEMGAMARELVNRNDDYDSGDSFGQTQAKEVMHLSAEDVSQESPPVK